MEENLAPAAPVLLGSQPETSPSDYGTGAIPDGDWIRVVWIPPQDELSGYEVYRRSEEATGDSLIAFVPVVDVVEISPDTVSWIDEGVSHYVRYFYRIRAVNRTGRRSDFSNMADYKLLPKPILDAPRGEVREATPEFRFWWGGEASWITAYVIKLIDSKGGHVWISEKIYLRGYEQPVITYYNSDGRAREPQLSPGLYRWRVDVIGPEPRCGSKSEWVEFSIRAR
ncbi:MAG TPA: fibronectin type III domain-containing protein [Candidatus Latescibacteria bacterium]|nr:fibronectin type III domain-containing protein [Candidatus Latescibacterota bacterium]